MAHIMDVRVGLVPTGWECPRCRHVYAPLTAECFRCSPPSALVLPRDGDRPVLHLPPYMAAENAVQVACVRTVWNEVFPGLEASLRSVRTGSAEVEFRLTPKVGDEPPDA